MTVTQGGWLDQVLSSVDGRYGRSAVRAALQLGWQCPWTPDVRRAGVRAVPLPDVILSLAGDVVRVVLAFCGVQCDFSLDILG
ncbi:uncharacterized protein LOC120352371 isoform X2 [Nilaparvata lugens]|uniref:uncharacterized protein LOC120352371 isoform X2 n=1 Tax=Nilaparvata lugens TaxID=108931 RepID=UPI00193DE785|nr:uncharacterized protein LOC120352371 isoform X2 [Nilaparvata lugens]